MTSGGLLSAQIVAFLIDA